MVRLKASTISQAKQIANSFQFLMVRLKAETVAEMWFELPHFNSLWCD